MDPLALLERPDKWFLGGGRTLIYAPPFPQYLETPGLWDDAHLLDFAHPRPFTWTLLDENDREIPLRYESRSWRPDRMTRMWSTQQGLSVTEHTSCLRDNLLIAEIHCHNDTSDDRTLAIVAWTIQRHDGNRGDEHLFDGGETSRGIQFARQFTPIRRGHALSYVLYEIAVMANVDSTSESRALSQMNSLQPIWRFTPFASSVRDGRLPFMYVEDDNRNGYVYMAVTYSLAVPSHGAQDIVLAARIGDFQSPRSNWPKTDGSFLAIAREQAEREWCDWFAQVPFFDCSDQGCCKVRQW